MLTMVEARTAQGETLALPLQDVSTGYIIEDITGLGPVKATLVASKFAQMDGTLYQASRREARNIVLKVGLEPDYGTSSVFALRSRLYDFFMPKSEVTLRFNRDDAPTVVIAGRVESCEPSIFTRDPEVSISIMCFKPDFVSLTTTTFNGSTASDSLLTPLDYEGSTETGLVFTLRPNRSITGVTLYNYPEAGDDAQLEYVGALQSGDILEISTVQGAKGAWLTRSGIRSSVLYNVSPTSSYSPLYRGMNQLRAQVSGAPMPFSIEYTARYGGL